MSDAQKLKVKLDNDRKAFIKDLKNKGQKIWGQNQNGLLGAENEIQVLVPNKPPRVRKQTVIDEYVQQDREDLSDVSADISDDIQRDHFAIQDEQDENSRIVQEEIERMNSEQI